MNTKFSCIWSKLKELDYKVHAVEDNSVTFVKMRRFGSTMDDTCIKMDRYVTLYDTDESVQYSVCINNNQWQCFLKLNQDNTLNTENSMIYVFSEFGGVNQIKYTLKLNNVNEDIRTLFNVLSDLSYYKGLSAYDVYCDE